MLLESVIKYSKPDFKQALMARVNTMREDSRRQDEELFHFAQLMDPETISDAPREPKKLSRDQIGAMREFKPKKRMNCHNCGKSRHMKKDCRNQSSSSSEDIVLGIGCNKYYAGKSEEKGRERVSSVKDILASIESVEDANKQTRSLLHFQQRFGHLNYDTIERIAKLPEPGIEIDDHRRLKCLTCAEASKQRTDSLGNIPV
ncbi:unnamed protein product [Albugo candida]|uniref:CCHC-type domain-containing protein n=1 Tax=Albugo candida TaxID=65357 RepID=A0A024GKL6_9STRA|nr:unnamed protein product [Albugo candida]|eukprot:CCI47279.1 unnamed protein product [Albugo candida]